MQTTSNPYDCAIIGGGLSALCLAIQLADYGHSVILFEKNQYPFHKVCGEYISNESYHFLERLGVPMAQMNLPLINQLGVSGVNGFMLEAPLTPGGFGISRYTLDASLAGIARQKGVIIVENCRVDNVGKSNNISTVYASGKTHQARLICGAYGRYMPGFLAQKTEKTKSNYLGVKYHIKSGLDANRIELHNFEGGYCGISKVDGDKFCMCYLTNSENLKAAGNNIKLMEETVLYKNPFLKNYFTESEFLFEKPITISQVTFTKKESYLHGIFLLGDSAGSIAPLCGNGMSMGMRSSFILSGILNKVLSAQISEPEAIELYTREWNKNFFVRIKSGYYIQHVFGKNVLTNSALKLLSHTPYLVQKVIGLTHGQPF